MYPVFHPVAAKSSVCPRSLPYQYVVLARCSDTLALGQNRGVRSAGFRSLVCPRLHIEGPSKCQGLYFARYRPIAHLSRRLPGTLRFRAQLTQFVRLHGEGGIHPSIGTAQRVVIFQSPWHLAPWLPPRRRSPSCGPTGQQKWLGLFEQLFPKDKWSHSWVDVLGKALQS
jgi:hypothetical protein